MSKKYFHLIFLLFVSACSSGGGSLSPQSLSNGTSLTYNSSVATDFQGRAEFDNINTHGSSVVTPYETINLHKALAYGLSGQGQQIMIMDSRFDKDHAEFADKTVTVHGTLDTAAADGSGGYHGNFVAGIAAADYNDNSDPSGLGIVTYSNPSGEVDTMMGVAHNADLFFADYTNLNGSAYYGTAWKAATDAASSAIVQNNSWGIDTQIDTVETYASDNSVSNAFASGFYYQSAGYTMNTEDVFQSYIDSLDNFQSHGAIVFAITNDTSFTNIDLSAGLPVLFPKLAEAWIAVGNTEVTGASGNHTYTRKGGVCGDAAAYCLQADGFEIFSIANVISDTSYNQGIFDTDQTSKKSGTSYAAPQVSGAIAILAEAFPNATPETLVDRLLASADNSFFTTTDTTKFNNGVTHGYNSEFGHGMLDIHAALNPITSSRMGRSILVGRNTGNSEVYPLERSKIIVPNLFGDVFDKKFKDSKGIFHDAMYGSFEYDYSKSFISKKKLSNLEKLEKHFENNNSKYLYQKNLNGDVITKFNGSPLSENYEPEFMFKSNFNNTRGSFNSYNLPLELTTGFINSNDKIFRNNMSEVFKIPFLSNGNNNTYSSGLFMDDLNNTTLSLYHTDTDLGTESTGVLLKTDLYNSSILLGYSNEEGGFLGSKSDAAFSKSTSTPTNFISHNFNKSINDRLHLLSLFSAGYTSIDGFQKSLVEDMSDIYSSSWGINLMYEGIKENIYSLSISQPHRVEQGSANFLLPKNNSLDGSLNFETYKVNLEPSGREINLSFKIDKSFNETSKISLENIITNNYMHNIDNNLEGSIFVSFVSHF